MIQEPTDELLTLVRRNYRAGEIRAADRQAAALIRRRFGLSLPPPFAEPLTSEAGGAVEGPIRPAAGTDGPAIAAVKWRSWRVGYRGVLHDESLDRLQVHPTVAYWTGRAALPPSRRHTLLVVGRPGEVHGFCDAGPATDDDLDPATVGRIFALYLDPTLRRQGVGTALLDAAVDRLAAAGFGDLVLWTITANAGARRFYEARGWSADGATTRWHFEDRPVEELRYRRSAPSPAR